jgi:ABC-type branched-subunit amino acid transport system ATPase component
VTAGLEVRDVVVRFDGRIAVDGLCLTAPRGRITGLIGPNGAGKTTTFNVCTGVLRPDSGQVTIDGRDVTRLGPARRAQLGLGRTFQRMELFDSMTVAENVALGREAMLVGASPLRLLVSRPNDHGEIDEAVTTALEQCGLVEVADRVAGELSTGYRRLTELARSIAGGASILLLDEPSSGLDRNETAAFARLLLGLVADRGVGILLVEHDMSLVLDICDHLHVLDFGHQIFEGDAEATAASPDVRAAYLGGEAAC